MYGLCIGGERLLLRGEHAALKFRIKVPSKAILLYPDLVKEAEAAKLRWLAAYSDWDSDPFETYNGYAGEDHYLISVTDLASDCQVIEGKYPDDDPAAGTALEDALMRLARPSPNA